MEVYIEYVLIDNLVINALLLVITAKVMSIRVSKIRLVLSDVLATLCSVVCPFISVSAFFLILLKVLVALMVMIVFCSHKSVGRFLATTLVFITATFVLGGVCFGLLYVCGMDTSISGIIIGGHEIPMGLMILLLSIYVYIMFGFVRTLKKKNSVDKLCYQVQFVRQDKRVQARGLLDSGNLIKGKYGESVTLINSKTFYRLFSSVPYIKLFSGAVTENDIPNSYYLTINNVTSHSKILVVSVDRLDVYMDKLVKSTYNAKVGLVLNLSSHDFDCILNMEMLKG